MHVIDRRDLTDSRQALETPETKVGSVEYHVYPEFAGFAGSLNFYQTEHGRPHGFLTQIRFQSIAEARRFVEEFQRRLDRLDSDQLLTNTVTF